MITIEDIVPADDRRVIEETGVTLVKLHMPVPPGMTVEQFMATTSSEGRPFEEDLADWIAELALLIHGWTPESARISEAPLLDSWMLGGVGDTVAIRGFVTGHPLVQDGQGIQAGPVLAMAPDRSWMRTLSRLYRLGDQFDERLQ
jgi:hypothetical protein